MAVTLLQQPASIVFAGNPVEYKFKSDNIVSTEGRNYQGILYLGGLPPDPENDAINVTGRKFTIKYSGIELKFEFVVNPDDSGLQLRSTAANLWAFQPILKADLESNYYISRDFIVTTAPQYGGVILTSRKKDAAYNITVESTSNIGANVFYYASPDGLNANFKILCEVWTRRFNQTEPELLTPVFLELDENNEAVYDISGALTTALTADGYDRPNMKLPTFEKAERNICEYYIRYAESFGDTQQVKKTHRTLTQIALLGGFSKALIGTDFVTYITGENDTIKFLTQAPSIKTIKPAQKDFLYWSNLNDYANVDVQVTVTFSDNSTATYIAHSFTDLLQYEKLVIPCGMLDLQVHLQQPNKIPVQYVLILKANGLSASPERTFLVDYQPQPYVQYYVFQNSFGGYESRYSYGKKSREYEILQDTAGRSQLGTYNLENGEVFSFGHLSQHKETVTTGYKTKFELKGWEEFFLAKEKFCLKNGLPYPINLASKTIKEWQDGDNLTALEFELSYAYTDEFFSIDEYEDGLPTLEQIVGWLPPIVNPDPENWDDRYYLKSEVYNQAQINALLSNIQNNFSALDESVQNQIAALTVALQQKAEKTHDHADLYVSAEEVQNLVLQFFLFQGEWTPDEEEEGFYTSGIFVEYDGGLYKSLKDLNFSVPGEDPAAWREIGGGATSFSELEGDPLENGALAAAFVQKTTPAGEIQHVAGDVDFNGQVEFYGPTYFADAGATMFTALDIASDRIMMNSLNLNQGEAFMIVVRNNVTGAFETIEVANTLFFQPILENQVGTHPAFNSQHELNLWLLENGGGGAPSDPVTYMVPDYVAPGYVV